MNHDNTQLIGDDGKKKARYHNFGAVPAVPFPEKHQQFAVATTIAASKEWFDLLSKEPLIKRAIQFAAQGIRRELILKNQAHQLVDGMIRSSCMVKKWDGAHPIASQAKICKQFQFTAQNVLVDMLRGSFEPLPTPVNKFWVIYLENNIMGHLIKGFADIEAGLYDFSNAGASLKCDFCDF